MAKSETEKLVRVEIYSIRLLFSTAALALVLALLTSFFIDGVSFGSVSATGLSDDDKRDLLSRYNSYSGTIASVIAIPYQQFVVMLVPVFFVCFTTEWVLRADKSFAARWAPAILALAISLLISQGLSAVNVQFDTSQTEFVMEASDLVASDYAQRANASSLVNENDSVGHLATQTSLFSALNSGEPVPETNCTNYRGVETRATVAAMDFGFHTNSWLSDLLPQALEVDASFTLSMTDNEAEDLYFPGDSIDKTARLFAYGFWTVYRIYADNTMNYDSTTVQHIYSNISAETSADLATNIQSFINFMSNDSGSTSDSEWLFHNISVNEISMNISTIQLTSEISFESATFDLPLKAELTQRDLTTSEASAIEFDDDSLSYQLYTPFECADSGCIMVLDGAGGTWENDVRLLRFCMMGPGSSVENITAFAPDTNDPENDICAYPSNSSVMIYSMAQRITAESVAYKSGVVALKNPRKIFSVTIGRLAWNTTDLASVFNAACEAGANCTGLHLPLSTGDQHLIVNADHLPSPQVVTLPRIPQYWQPLVATFSQIELQVDVISPEDYTFTSDSDTWSWANITGYACDNRWSNYVNKIVREHIYSRYSLQPAYTAGLFWLFQNAAIKDVQSVAGSNLLLLELNGNKSWLKTRVSIPTASAAVMFGGCGLMLLLGLLVVCSARNHKKQKALEQALTPHNVVEMVLNSQQYPPLLVSARINREASDRHQNGVALLQTGDVPVGDFVIDRVVLRHREDPEFCKELQHSISAEVA